MSTVNNHQIIPYLHRHDISHAMIQILEEQRINDEDLRTIDRDDIEHLFKNEYGFTFRDRKRFWNAILKFQSINTKDDIIYLEQEEQTPDIYDIIDNDEPPNYQLTQHYIPLAASNIPSSATIYNRLNTNMDENILELSSTEGDNDDNVQTATTSLPASDRLIHQRRLKALSDVRFRYPVVLPVFSSLVLRAFETNTIESEWQLLMEELTEWVLSIKQSPLMKREYQAIGQTLFKCYPCVGKDGFRPWSHLCKSLTQRIRKERKKRAVFHTLT